MDRKNSSESVGEKPYRNLFISGWAGYRYFFPTISSSFNFIIPFEEKADSGFELSMKKTWDVVAAWSLGAHMCLKNLHRIRARRLVLIAPFLDFCDSNPKNNVLKMISGLDRNPEATLAWFWRLCGIKNRPDMKIKNTDGLKKGLKFILDSRVPLDKLDSSISTIIVHGHSDRIVPMKVSQSIKTRMPQVFLVPVPHPHFIPEHEILKIINHAKPDS